MIEIIEAQSSNYQSFIFLHALQTYDGTHRVCYYVPCSGTSVIEGTYTQYQTDCLFGTAFSFSQFDNGKCKCKLKLFLNTFAILTELLIVCTNASDYKVFLCFLTIKIF